MNELDIEATIGHDRDRSAVAGMRRGQARIEPVRKSRTVPLSQAAAFELFTERMGTWWPLASHSLSQDASSSVRFEPRAGGRVVETTTTGEEHSWADVLTWDPPYRFVLAWHPSTQPVAATILEVRFRSAASGGTEVELEHRGWDELGDESGPAVRTDYASGWDVVLAPFTAAASDPAPDL